MSRVLASAFASLTCLASLPATAAADSAEPTGLPLAPAATSATPAMTTVARKFPPRRWYGWQMLAVDAGAWVGAFAYQPATLTLLASGPIVHLLHGEDERAQASLAVRLGGAVLGAAATGLALFKRSCPADRTTCPPGASTILRGAAVGLAVAGAIDVIGIAWTSTADGDDAIPPLMSSAPHGAHKELLPSLAIGASGAVLSLSGEF